MTENPANTKKRGPRAAEALVPHVAEMAQPDGAAEVHVVSGGGALSALGWGVVGLVVAGILAVALRQALPQIGTAITGAAATAYGAGVVLIKWAGLALFAVALALTVADLAWTALRGVKRNRRLRQSVINSGLRLGGEKETDSRVVGTLVQAANDEGIRQTGFGLGELGHLPARELLMLAANGAMRREGRAALLNVIGAQVRKAYRQEHPELMAALKEFSQRPVPVPFALVRRFLDIVSFGLLGLGPGGIRRCPEPGRLLDLFIEQEALLDPIGWEEILEKAPQRPLSSGRPFPPPRGLPPAPVPPAQDSSPDPIELAPDTDPGEAECKEADERLEVIERQLEDAQAWAEKEPGELLSACLEEARGLAEIFPHHVPTKSLETRLEALVDQLPQFDAWLTQVMEVDHGRWPEVIRSSLEDCGDALSPTMLRRYAARRYLLELGERELLPDAQAPVAQEPDEPPPSAKETSDLTGEIDAGASPEEAERIQCAEAMF